MDVGRNQRLIRDGGKPVGCSAVRRTLIPSGPLGSVQSRVPLHGSNGRRRRALYRAGPPRTGCSRPLLSVKEPSAPAAPCLLWRLPTVGRTPSCRRDARARDTGEGQGRQAAARLDKVGNLCMQNGCLPLVRWPERVPATCEMEQVPATCQMVRTGAYHMWGCEISVCMRELCVCLI